MSIELTRQRFIGTTAEVAVGIAAFLAKAVEDLQATERLGPESAPTPDQGKKNDE